MAEKKKILYIVEAMGGGVFTYIVDLANELVNKYDMYIAYAVRKQTPKNYKDYFDKRIHLIEVKNFRRAIDPMKDIAAFFEVKKIAAEIKPDIIHLHSSKAGAIGRMAFNGKIPMFYTPHGYSFLMENYKPMKRRMFKLIESVCAKRNCTTMLKITNDGRKLALDQRLINDLLPDEPESKVNLCVENAYQVWEESTPDKSTQLIFCDLSTPKTDGTFNVYDDVREKLVAKGIPREEIAFIHEANTETKKAELFAKVRSGQVRILLGSTPKLGAGTNIQDRLIALHHLDCPWKPSDLEQQEGRILRQGNRNQKVKIFRYVTENTFDSYMWQILENKQKFISQIMTSKSPVRACDDVDDTALTYAEIKALATGNPYIKEKMDLDIQVSKLKLMRANHTSQIYSLESDIARRYPAEITAAKERIAGLKADLAVAKPLLEQDKEKFSITVEDRVYTDRKEAGSAILAACAAMKIAKTEGQIANLGGFAISSRFDAFAQTFKLTIKRQSSYTIELGSDPAGNIQRILNALASIEKTLPQVERRLETLQQQLAEAKEEVQRPFPQEAELNEKSARLAELNALLDMDEKGDDAALGMDEEVPDSELPAPKREIERSADSVKRPSIKSIGFSLEDGSIYSGMFDLMVGGEVQAEVVNHIQHYRESPLVQKAISDMKTLLEKRQASKELEERPNTRQSVREALKNRKKAQEQQSNQEQAKPKKAKKKGEMER